MTPDVTLICFATGDIYRRYAQVVEATAAEYFFPGRSQYLQLETTPAWPHASRDRYPHIVRNAERIEGHHVFMIDADMRFEGPVGDEILADGITVTSHYGFPPGTPPEALDYDRNPESVAYVPFGKGRRYYPGAFIGGPKADFVALAEQIAAMIEADGDYIPNWYDEAYLNRILIDSPPALELDERYCCWHHLRMDDVRIRALNKTQAEYRWRDSQPAECPI